MFYDETVMKLNEMNKMLKMSQIGISLKKRGVYMKKIIIQFSVALLLITGIYVYKYNNEKDLEVSNISQDIMNDYEDIIIKHGNEDEKVIALTFDDGPDKDFTPQVLDILKKNNVKATFFVVGENVEWNAEILKRTT